MQQALTLAKYKVRFKGGIETVLSANAVRIIDEAFALYTTDKIDQMITLPNKSKVRVSKLDQIEPYIDEETLREEHNKSVFSNIEKIMEESEISKTSTIAQIHLQRMKENFKRLKNKQPWQYCDRNGNPCAKEDARLSIFGDQDLINHAKSLF